MYICFGLHVYVISYDIHNIFSMYAYTMDVSKNYTLKNVHHYTRIMQFHFAAFTFLMNTKELIVHRLLS